ncbi:MAG: ComEC/Rec2 family competence protein [Oscillospiraceae bacterium]|nr:ComEC/Rec2 family competence protein [Oscillospiraceae bacterium]
MKRPFALIGIVCFIAAVIMGYLSVFTVSAIGFAALAVFLLSVFLISPKSKYIWIILMSFGIAAISVSMLFVMKDYESASVYNDKNVEFSGTVISSNYYSTYEKLEIKVNCVNGKKEKFRISVYSGEKTGLSEGDEISANAKFKLIYSDSKNEKSLLANKLYFNADNMENYAVAGKNAYYKAIYKVKQTYKNAVQSYLPNELGLVALGITVGGRDGMSAYLRNCFNYSGTAHLLVVSGLHLTLWTLFLSNFIPVLRKRRLLNAVVTLVFIILYSALTGFSVSVVRAGVMLFIIKLSKLLNRDSDSLNSLGFAMAILLIQNPLSVYSVSFLLSMGSTLGLVLFSGQIHNIIYRSRAGRLITKSFIGRLIADSFAVSISVSVFTLPVFILFFNMFPIFSFISNIFIIDLSSFLMILTVLGVLAHFGSVIPLAKCLFYFAGIIAKMIVFIAEKIGMMRYSTVAVSSRYFKAFLIFAVVIFAVLILALKKHRKIRNIILSAVLITGFVFTVFVNENFELSHPSVDISLSGDCVSALVRDGYDSVFIGAENKNADYVAGSMLESHNLKTIGCLYIADTDDYTFARIQNITNSYPVNSLAFAGESVPLLKNENGSQNVKSVTLNGVISVTPVSPKTVVIQNSSEDIFISCDNSMQNLLEIDRKYDIIILNTDSFKAYGEEAKQYLKDESSQIIALGDEQITVYPDVRKIYYSESF